jgi:hypothetical protein
MQELIADLSNAINSDLHIPIIYKEITITETIVFQKNILEIQKIQWVIILQPCCKINKLLQYIKLTINISMVYYFSGTL